MRKLLSFRRTTVVAAVASLVIVSVVSVALGDNVQVNDTVTGGDVTNAAPGSSGSARVRIVANSSPTGDLSGCNVDATHPATVTLSSNQAWVTFPSGNSVQITACGNGGVQAIPYSVSGSAPFGATATISTSTTGGLTGSTYNDNFPFTITTQAAPPDSTPPVITPNVSGTLGNNGWYTSDVNVSWSVSDPDSSISSSSGCGPTTISTDTAGTTLTCTATSAGGTNSASVTIKRDATAPTDVATTLDRVSDHNGWYNAPVGWTTTGTDATSLIDSCSTGTYSGPDGTGLTVSGKCTDQAGNESGSVSSAEFKYDNTDPTVSVTGVSHGATYIRGSVPAAGCNTQDNLSGVQTAASLAMSGPGTTNPNGVGSFTATCSGGKDKANNSQGPASATYSVIYDPAGLSGILQPINPDNTSLFSRGKAVPVKFRLAGDEPSGFNYSGWTLQRIKVVCTNFDSADAAIEAVVENPSNAFRYDASADQYVNNASFKDQAAGTCWKVRVTLDSNQTMDSAVFSLQR